MKRPALIATAVAMLALAANAGPALASGFTLELSAPPAIVGKPLVLKATGTIPVDEIQFPYWFSLDAIPTAVMTTCPPDRWEGAQIANGAGGAVIVLSQRETPDTAGRFTIPVAVNPIAPGSLLHTDDGLTNTLAGASLLLDISSGAAPSPPQQLAQAIRSCHALLGGAGEGAASAMPSSAQKPVAVATRPTGGRRGACATSAASRTGGRLERPETH